jgi:hypothetical protein
MAPGEQDMAVDDKTLSTAVASSVENVPSPGADQGGQSLLDAMQDAVPELRINANRNDDGDRDSPTHVARDDESDLPDEAPPEELAKLSQSAKRRVSKLNKQRIKLAAEVQRLKALEPSAQAANQVTQYLRTHDIGQDDFLMGLELMAAMRRGDFLKFYEGVRPYVKLCEEYLGISLPPDLQQKVQQGHMTTEAAAMFSRERMDKAMAQTNVVRQQAVLTQHQQTASAQQSQQQREVLANQVVTTVNAWEARVASQDPDYAAKKAAVQNTMHAVMAEQGPPRSAEHGVQIAQEAYRRVNEQYKAWIPQRRPTYRNPSSTGRTAGAPAPEAKNLLEAVRFAREGARL